MCVCVCARMCVFMEGSDHLGKFASFPSLAVGNHPVQCSCRSNMDSGHLSLFTEWRLTPK